MGCSGGPFRRPVQPRNASSVSLDNLPDAGLPEGGGRYQDGGDQGGVDDIGAAVVRFAPFFLFLSSTSSDASSFAGLTSERLPHDVRIFFPHLSSEEGVELWTWSALLSSSSDWFKDALASGFVESIHRRSKRARRSSPQPVVPPMRTGERDFDDSDDETDSVVFSKRPPKHHDSDDADELSYRQITITQTAYSTYSALLAYLTTGFIHFIPLSSIFQNLPRRAKWLDKKLDTQPSLPSPISPKSMYRLAHMHGLVELQKRCLDFLPSSLSTQNAGIELFSDTSIAYDDWRKVIIVWVEEHWQEVKGSSAWKEISTKVKSGGMAVGAMPVLMEVIEAVAK
jgi:hypothetical protein